MFPREPVSGRHDVVPGRGVSTTLASQGLVPMSNAQLLSLKNPRLRRWGSEPSVCACVWCMWCVCICILKDMPHPLWDLIFSY